MAKTNSGLVEYAKAQLGRPYWLGTFGNAPATEQLWNAKARQYSKYYTKARKEVMKSRGDLGQKVHDCSGLIKGYLMSKDADSAAEYDAKYDISADDLFKRATVKGSIDTLPKDRVGLGLHKAGHVGVYIGGGREIEARGFDYGVLEDDVKAAGFTEWFEIPYIEYTGSQEAQDSDNSADNAPDSPAQDENVYTVVKGDTLGKLAKKWNTTVDAIVDLNGIDNPDLIIVGQKIKIPGEAPAVTTWTGVVNTQRDRLRVRAGRGTNCDVVKLLDKGSDVEIIGGAVDGWYELADGSGYVSSIYIVRK